jgi:hypothetical protein
MNDLTLILHFSDQGSDIYWHFLNFLLFSWKDCAFALEAYSERTIFFVCIYYVIILNSVGTEYIVGIQPEWDVFYAQNFRELMWRLCV